MESIIEDIKKLGLELNSKDGSKELRLTRYVAECSQSIQDGESGANQETIPEGNKSVVLMLLKQLRPGMDLSRIVLPTFILEPRSMLEKLSDFASHGSLLEVVPTIQDPLGRLVALVRWYLSGFYLKPKGVKKPYNPILGEIFRCRWTYPSPQETNSQKSENQVESSPKTPKKTKSPKTKSKKKEKAEPSTDSSPSLSPKSQTSDSPKREKENHSDNPMHTFFVAEQVSHHPPISAFYLSNRRLGVIANGSIHFKTKFTGLSAGSILDGVCSLWLLPFEEEYTISFPDVWASGFVFGNLLMEMVGKVEVVNKTANCRAEIDFKSKSLIGGSYNAISGKIYQQEEAKYSFSGKWDGKIKITNLETNVTEVYWNPTPEARATKFPKEKPPKEEMKSFESDLLWSKVSAAIERDDQETATDEKAKLEQMQRDAAKERSQEGQGWTPNLFRQTPEGTWEYQYMNRNLWDPQKEYQEVEENGIIFSIDANGNRVN